MLARKSTHKMINDFRDYGVETCTHKATWSRPIM